MRAPGAGHVVGRADVVPARGKVTPLRKSLVEQPHGGQGRVVLLGNGAQRVPETDGVERDVVLEYGREGRSVRKRLLPALLVREGAGDLARTHAARVREVEAHRRAGGDEVGLGKTGRVDRFDAGEVKPGPGEQLLHGREALRGPCEVDHHELHAGYRRGLHGMNIPFAQRYAWMARE